MSTKLGGTEFFATKNIAWTEVKLPEVVLSSPWLCLLTEREKEVLAYSLMKHFVDIKASGPQTPSADSEGRQFVAVDLSQRLDRARVTSSPNLFFTMLPSQKVWVLARSSEGLVLHNRLLTGKECLKLQGFPEVSGHQLQVTDHQQQDLGGNAFASTILMALLLSLYSHMPQYIWTDQEEEGADVVAAEAVQELLCDIDNLD